MMNDPCELPEERGSSSLQSELGKLSDLELQAIVSVDREGYSSDAIEVASGLLRGRGVSLPSTGAYEEAEKRYVEENKSILSLTRTPVRATAIGCITALLGLAAIGLLKSQIKQLLEFLLG